MTSRFQRWGRAFAISWMKCSAAADLCSFELYLFNVGPDAKRQLRFLGSGLTLAACGCKTPLGTCSGTSRTLGDPAKIPTRGSTRLVNAKLTTLTLLMSLVCCV